MKRRESAPSLCLVGRGSARGDKDRVPAKKREVVIVGHDGGDFSTSLEMTGEGMLEITGDGMLGMTGEVWPPSSE